jgi:hypothetical protein
LCTPSTTTTTTTTTIIVIIITPGSRVLLEKLIAPQPVR